MTTQAELKKYFRLDEVTNFVYCKKVFGNNRRVKMGDRVGAGGSITFKGKLYSTSRFVFLYLNGYLPRVLYTKKSLATKHGQEWRRLYEVENKTQKEIATIFNCSDTLVNQTLLKLGYAPHEAYSKEERQKWVSDYQNGISVAEIAQESGCSTRPIRRAMADAGIGPAPRPKTYLDKELLNQVESAILLSRIPPTSKQLAVASVNSKPLSPENFARIPSRPGIYLLRIGKDDFFYYVGFSRDMHSRLCHLTGRSHFKCYTHAPFDRGGNPRIWNYVRKHGIDSLRFSILEIFDKFPTKEEAFVIETLWIRTIPTDLRLNVSDDALGAKTVSPEEASERVRKISNGTVELEGDYTYSQAKIRARCLVCGYRWTGFPYTLFRSDLCPKCSWRRACKEKAYSQKEFVAAVKQANPNNVAIGQYQTIRHQILTRCRTCKFEWRAWPASLLRGGSCKQCAWDSLSETRMLPIEEANKRIEEKFKGRVELWEYQGISSKSKFFCTIHKRTWDAQLGNVLRGVGCPECVSKHISDDRRKPDKVILKQVNPSLEVLEIMKDDVTVRCRNCKRAFSKSRRNVMNGCGCPYCSGRKSVLSEADHEKMVRFHREGKSVWAIAEIYNCSGQNVLNILRKSGRYKSHTKHYSPDDQARMAELYQSGYSQAKTAQQVGCSIDTVVAALRKMKIDTRPSGPTTGFGKGCNEH
jgi:transposase-like protein